MSLIYQRIRILLDTTRPLVTMSLRDYVTQERIKIGYNRAVAFEVAVGKGKIVTDQIGDVSTITMVVKPVTTGGVIDVGVASLLEKTVAVTNTTLTQAQWANDSAEKPYHAILQFADSETVISMVGAVKNELTLGIAFTGLTEAGRITLGSGLVTLQNDGAVITGGVVPVATRLMTDAEILALMSSKVGFTGNPAGSMIVIPSAAGKKIVMYARDEDDGSITFKAETI